MQTNAIPGLIIATSYIPVNLFLEPNHLVTDSMPVNLFLEPNHLVTDIMLTFCGISEPSNLQGQGKYSMF
jgi:hypothetical protein